MPDISPLNPALTGAPAADRTARTNANATPAAAPAAAPSAITRNAARPTSNDGFASTPAAQPSGKPALSTPTTAAPVASGTNAIGQQFTIGTKGDVASMTVTNRLDSIDTDRVYLGKDGTLKGDTGIRPYSSSYAAIQHGPLREAHGSKAPSTKVLTDAELKTVNGRVPGDSLNRMSRLFRARTYDFVALASNPKFFNPLKPVLDRNGNPVLGPDGKPKTTGAEEWEGFCHGYGYTSLNRWINERVDAPGPSGQRGVWVGGEWMSSADLKNWVMALAGELSVTKGATHLDLLGNKIIEGRYNPMDPRSKERKQMLNADDWLKVINKYLMRPSVDGRPELGGGGVVGDIDPGLQVWNQPFYGADLTTKTITGAGAQKLLAKANVKGATTVKQVTADVRYGIEVDDGNPANGLDEGYNYEGPGKSTTDRYNMYCVCGPDGEVLKTFYANEPEIRDIGQLPHLECANAPQYVAKPNFAPIDDILAGRRNEEVERNRYGSEIKFFVGTVLAKGVTGATRAAFEQEVDVGSSKAFTAAAAKKLAAKYPGVANAYSPAQWEKFFKARGLDAAAFGAAWPAPTV